MYIYMHTYMRMSSLMLKMVLLFLSMLHIGGELEVATYRDRDRDCGTSPAISCMYAYICMYKNTPHTCNLRYLHISDVYLWFAPQMLMNAVKTHRCTRATPTRVKRARIREWLQQMLFHLFHSLIAPRLLPHSFGSFLCICEEGFEMTDEVRF